MEKEITYKVVEKTKTQSGTRTETTCHPVSLFLEVGMLADNRVPVSRRNTLS